MDAIEFRGISFEKKMRKSYLMKCILVLLYSSPHEELKVVGVFFLPPPVFSVQSSRKQPLKSFFLVLVGNRPHHGWFAEEEDA